MAEICDIAELLRSYPQIDWEKSEKEASRIGCQRILLLGLLLAHELLEADLPENVLSKIKAEPVLRPLAAQVIEWIFLETENPSRNVEKKLFYFQVRERQRDRIPYFTYRLYMKIAPNKADRRFMTIPNYLDFLYYLVRPIRLLNKQWIRFLKWQGRRVERQN